MTVKRPLISVGIPVYNGAATLRRALDSLVTQDVDDVEFIITDNASSDTTCQIAREYAASDSRFRVYTNHTNLGLARNFNRALELARGRYFKWATHDDWHAPQSLRLTVEALEADPSAAVCVTGVSWVDQHEVEFHRWTPSVDLACVGPAARARWVIGSMAETHPMYGLLRTDLLRRTPGMRRFLGSDRTMLAELALLGPWHAVPDVLHYYTVATDRIGYQPSIAYDPANAGALPLRTWRLIYEHLAIVARADLGPADKARITETILRRFAVGDARRLAAEAYRSTQILGLRAVRRVRSRRRVTT